MQRCLRVAKATHSWHAARSWIVSEPEVWAIGMNQSQQRRPKSRDGMVETTKNPGDKTLSVAPTKTLTLKRGGVEQGVVRQSFSHGRSKAVVVEKVKRRAGPGEGKPEPAPRIALPRRGVPPPRLLRPPKPCPPRRLQAPRLLPGRRHRESCCARSPT